MEYNSCKRGFTLAEVLITLTILGVIAGIIIPNIIWSYKKLCTEVKLKQAYSTLTNALDAAAVVSNQGTYANMMRDAYSQSSTTKGRTDHFVQNYVAPYIDNRGICLKGDTCSFYNDGSLTHYKGGSRNWIQGLNNQESPNIGKPSFYARVLLKNGVVIGFWQDSGCGTPYIIIIDVNGNKAPNKFGYDVFGFNLFTNHKFIVPVSNKCSINNDFSKVSATCSGNGYDCAFPIMKNHWKIPSDYPVKRF